MSAPTINEAVEEETDASLVACLNALASSNRLAILRKLRTPRALKEIEVSDAEGTSHAPLARQTVRRHLDPLIETGIVQTRDATRDYGDTTEFVINHQRIYALADEVRGLARLRPSVEPEAPTLRGESRSASPQNGSALVLVKGLDEGTMYSLDPVDGRTRWDIGRRRGAGIPLDFDPAVSSEHATIDWDGTGHGIKDGGSRNGTTLNMRPIPTEERLPLAHGDIIGVGLSYLVYWR